MHTFTAYNQATQHTGTSIVAHVQLPETSNCPHQCSFVVGWLLVLQVNCGYVAVLIRDSPWLANWCASKSYCVRMGSCPAKNREFCAPF